jgi:hypothetical protein
MYDIDAAVVLGLTYPPLYSGSPETNKIFMGGNELCCRGKKKKKKRYAGSGSKTKNKLGWFQGVVFQLKGVST